MPRILFLVMIRLRKRMKKKNCTEKEFQKMNQITNKTVVAATVKKEMVDQGIAEGRIETAGMGEADPIADNATEEGRAQNRRTELVIIRK